MDAERRLEFDDDRRLEAKGLARAKARSRRLRVARIRRTTIRGSLALFAVLWGVIFVQLASGNDPVLSAKRAHRHAARAARVAADDRAPIREPAPEAESEMAPPPESEWEALVREEEEARARAEAEFEAAPEPVAPIVTSVS